MTRVRWMALCFALGSTCFLIGPFPGYVQLVGEEWWVSMKRRVERRMKFVSNFKTFAKHEFDVRMLCKNEE